MIRMYTRGQLAQAAGIKDTKEINAFQGVMSYMATHFGLAIDKEGGHTLARGAKCHMYIAQEVMLGLERYIQKRTRTGRDTAARRVSFKVLTFLDQEFRNDQREKEADVDRHELLKLEKTLEKGTAFELSQSAGVYVLIKKTNTQKKAMSVRLKGNRLTWTSSSGRRGEYNFVSNQQAEDWAKEHIIGHMV